MGQFLLLFTFLMGQLLLLFIFLMGSCFPELLDLGRRALRLAAPISKTRQSTAYFTLGVGENAILVFVGEDFCDGGVVGICWVLVYVQ